MKLNLIAAISAALLIPLTPVFAHEGDGTGIGVTEHTSAEGNVVEGSIVVPGTVRELKPLLYAFERWPAVFTDLRALERRPDGSWALDFARFGHPHDFFVRRTSRGVILEIAARDHGTARMEYELQPYDRTRSILRVRFVMSTPPQLSQAAFLELLRGKLVRDLEDFARAANAATAPSPDSPPAPAR